MSVKENNKQTLILEAAGKRFLYYGYEKTSIDEIARDLGIGKATIYHYYQSKEEIFLSVLKKEAQHLRQLVLNALKQVKSPHEKLHVFIKTHFEYIMERFHTNSLTGKHWSELQSVVNKGFQEFYEDQLALLRGILQEGIRKKSFHPFDTHQIAVLLLSLLRIFVVPGVMIEKTTPPQNMVQNLVNIITRGIENQPQGISLKN